MNKVLRLVIFLFVLSFSLSIAQSEMKHGDSPDHIMMNSAELEWVAGPASLPSGSRMAILEGNPAKEGPFTLRLEMPANYKIQPHWHPGIEHISVISGEFYMGLGEKFVESEGSKLEPAGFAVMQIGTRHFAFTKDEPAVIQLHGIGPWKINYINPTDDPRNNQTSN